MINMDLIKRALFILFITVASFNTANGQREYSVCRRGVNPSQDSICRRLPECQTAIEGLKNNIFPKICGYVNSIPVVCCAPSQTATTTTSTRSPFEPPLWGPHPAQSSTSTTRNPTVMTTKKPTQPRPQKNPITIAEAMCAKYKEYQYKTEVRPGLLLGEPATVSKKPDCSVAETLIIGGQKAEPKQFPHMAMLGYGTSYKYVLWACAGSLISERFVLTAAHCVSNARGSAGMPKWIRLGDLNYATDTDDAKPQDFGIEQHYIHPNYKYPSVYDDIALLRLNRDAVLNSYVRPLCLQTKYVINSENASATGWGVLGPGYAESETLMSVQLPFVSIKACNESYGVNSKYARGIDAYKMICAGAIQGKDTCEGDSGGPLQIKSQNDPCMHIQVGITSFGSFLCGEQLPGVFTRVSNYIPWIQSIVWPN